MEKIMIALKAEKKLTARQIAVIRYVWSLSVEEVALLNICVRRQLTTLQLAEELEIGKGKLFFGLGGSGAYTVIWEGRSKDILQESSIVQVSYRANYKTNLRVALVRVINHG